MPRIILVKNRDPPPVRSLPVTTSVAFAYGIANNEERPTYVSLFCDKPEVEDHNGGQ
jgi:hypothetical protein